jgi:hypothetical protein
MAEIIEKYSPTATRLLGDTERELTKYIEAGYSMKESCRLSGVPYLTFRMWMTKGSDPKADPIHKCPDYIHYEPYYSFARRMRAAEVVGKRQFLPRLPSGPPPADINEEQKAVILYGLRSGWSYHAACNAAKIRLSTFISWLHRGGYPRQVSMAHPVPEEAREEKYVIFVKEVIRAEDEFLTG